MMSEGVGVSTPQGSESTISESATSSSLSSSHLDRNANGPVHMRTSDVKDLGNLIKKPNTSSKAWANFKVYEKDQNTAHCCINGCKKPDFKIADGSTGHLNRHLAT